MSAIKNIAVTALETNKRKVIAQKIFSRIIGKRGSITESHNHAWLKEQSITDEAWLSSLDADLWKRAVEKKDAYFQDDVERIKGKYPSEIHAPGGAYAMLYFLVRYFKPEYVVETGVSLGCSSHAILTAMEENGIGTLHSSDFPYFRLENASQYVGLVVPEHLKSRWSLYLDGDSNNLPKILNAVPQIDLFHYDSDKSYEGRQYAYNAVKDKMAPNSLILFDDSNDNPFFHDIVKKEKLQERSHVLAYKGKFIGVIDM